MEAALSLCLCCAFAYAFAKPVKSKAPVFYIVFACVGVLFATGVVSRVLPHADLILIPFLRRAPLAFGLFSVVMFIGVLPEGGAFRKRLQPIRGELSLLGFVLVAVHVACFAPTFFATLIAGNATAWIAVGIVIGVVVAVLLLILSATSVQVVHKAMDGAAWKRLQKLAYPFYLLMYAHLVAMLAPSSMSGGSSLANLTVYTIVVFAYIVLKLRSGAVNRRGNEVSEQ